MIIRSAPEPLTCLSCLEVIDHGSSTDPRARWRDSSGSSPTGGSAVRASNRLALLGIWLCACAVGLAAEVPAGHPDFYPTVERPLGWRADGTGAFLGATPVTSFDAASGKNIAWKSAMPGPSFAVPLVVGHRVFTLADPNILVCCDIHDGRILWQAPVDHTEAMPEPRRTQARELIAWYDAQYRAYGAYRERAQVILDRAGKAGLGNPIKDCFFTDPSKVAGWDQLDQTMRNELSGIHTEAKDKGYCFGVAGNSTVIDIKHAFWKSDLQRLLEVADVYSVTPWYGWVNNTYANLATDGKRIYVQIAHTVASYDLDGKQAWLNWDQPDPKVYDLGQVCFSTRFVSSPTLFHDRMVVRGNDLLRVYDCETGKKIWETYTIANAKKGKNGRIQLSARQTPENGHPALMRLPLPKGGHLDVLIDSAWTSSPVYRLKDGKVLRTDLNPAGSGVTIVQGDLVFMANTHDKRDGKHVVGARGWVYQLSATDDETIAVKELWYHPGMDTVQMLRDGKLYGQDGKTRIDFLTGEKDAAYQGAPVPGKYTWGIIGGTYVVRAGPGKDKGAPGQVNIGFTDTTTGKSAGKGILLDNRLSEDKEWSELWKHRGSMVFLCDHSPSFAGNRMFMRTYGYLWCIGDPRQPYQGRQGQ